MNEILDILTATGAIIDNNHFVLTSGKHSPRYINKDALYPHTKETARIGELFAEKFKDVAIDVVVGPAFGGIILSQWTGYYLTKLKKQEVLSVYTEKTPDSNQIFRRGYDAVIKGKNVLVVEDLTSTGGSVKKVMVSIAGAGATVAAVGVMVNRNPQDVTTETIGVPFYALAELPTEIYDPENCPLCKKGIPINITVGHGKKFLESRKNLPA